MSGLEKEFVDMLSRRALDVEPGVNLVKLTSDEVRLLHGYKKDLFCRGVLTPRYGPTYWMGYELVEEKRE